MSEIDWKELTQELKKPFPAADHKERKLPGGNKWLFLPWQKIRDRLDEVCLGNWSATYSDPVVVADYMVIRCRLIIHGVTREGIGNDKAYPELNESGKAKTIGTPPERAAADAFKNAAEQFGIGAYIDDQKFVATHLHRQGDGRGVKFVQENGWRDAGAMGKPKAISSIANDITVRITEVKKATGASNQDIQRIASRVLGRAIATSSDIKTEQECIKVCEAILNTVNS